MEKKQNTDGTLGQIEAEVILQKWHTEQPRESGYYLATWTSGDNVKIVSELWFLKNTLYSSWWNTRGYFGQSSATGGKEIKTVIGWIEMPQPFLSK